MSARKTSLNVIYDDNHVLGVMKPSGMLSQGDNTGDDSVLEHGKEYLREKYKKPGNIFLGCVHRLDRVTSGVMVYAKTSKGLKRLNAEFAERRVEKRYMAIVEGGVPEMQDTLKHYLKKNPNTNTVKAYDRQKSGAKKAVLNYKMLGEINGMYLLDIELDTGRPHQIRAQMAQMGFPIVGDGKYGSTAVLSKREIALHCYFLKVKHPTKDEQVTLKYVPNNNEPWRKFMDLIKHIVKGA